MAVGRPRFTLDFFPLSSPPPPTPRRLAGPRGGGASAAAAAVDPSEHAGGSFFRFFFPHSFAFFLSFFPVRPSFSSPSPTQWSARTRHNTHTHADGVRRQACVVYMETKRRLGPTRFFSTLIEKLQGIWSTKAHPARRPGHALLICEM